MTARTTAIDHSSRRLVVALPQTYEEARERYESLVPEIDFARFSEMAALLPRRRHRRHVRLTVVVEDSAIPDG